MLYYRYHGKILTILPIWVCLRDPCATPNQFAPQTLSQSLAIQGFGRAGSLFTFPRKGTETRILRLQCLSAHDHYLHFPVRGRKPDELVLINPIGKHHYLHFPVRGRKPIWASLSMRRHSYHYLHFPVRGRKLFRRQAQVPVKPIIIYISP